MRSCVEKRFVVEAAHQDQVRHLPSSIGVVAEPVSDLTESLRMLWTERSQNAS
jgi:hypothetical protein